MTRANDRWRETPPTIDDSACAELAARFMAGEVETNSNRGRRYQFDGKRDGVTADGRKYRTRAGHKRGAVRRRGETRK